MKVARYRPHGEDGNCQSAGTRKHFSDTVAKLRILAQLPGGGLLRLTDPDYLQGALARSSHSLMTERPEQKSRACHEQDVQTSRKISRRGMARRSFDLLQSCAWIWAKRPGSVKNTVWPQRAKISYRFLRGASTASYHLAASSTGVLRSCAPEIGSIGTGISGISAIRSRPR